ncbi:uncharacterized protein LOC135949073 [Calliphora vicina]|uniref:uncharacterized protein LOC135949073 n=1 Tax=Calliphora vicina TaxID=7373 RepID=UPI00325BF0E4
MRLSEEESLTKCRSILGKMKAAMARQRNINRDVQNGVLELDELLDIIADYRRNWKTAEEEREVIKPHKALQICQDTPTIPRNKRSALSPAETNPMKKQKKKTSGNSTAVAPTETQTEDAPETRRGKKDRRNPRPKKPKKRPDAVVIKPRDGHSYADVLKNLKTKVNPEETEVAIQSVRKTKSGSILLVMGQGGRKDEFREAIMSTLKEEATVQDMKSKATIEIQDHDSLTTEEEVLKAIQNVANITEEDTNIRLTATNSREQKRAFVSLPTADANTLLEKRRILIGWTYCRIRYMEEVKRCYKCFESGHTQWDCKGPDRKSMGLCIRCGQKGHKMKECRNPPKCCICSQSEGRPTDHMPGSRSCKPPKIA